MTKLGEWENAAMALISPGAIIGRTCRTIKWRFLGCIQFISFLTREAVPETGPMQGPASFTGVMVAMPPHRRQNRKE